MAVLFNYKSGPVFCIGSLAWNQALRGDVGLRSELNSPHLKVRVHNLNSQVSVGCSPHIHAKAHFK